MKQICKKFLKNNNLYDIVIFGSFIRKKAKPKDIDIALIFKEKTNNKLKQNLSEKIPNSHISSILLKNLYDPKETLWKTLIHEGFSIKYNKKMSNILGFETKILFWYNLERLSQIEKVRFSYSLKGRNGKNGLLKDFNGTHIGKGSILVPLEADDELRQLFFNWKIPFNRRRILVEV